MPIYKRVNRKFFKVWSREMSYVLGFFAADGTMIVNNRGAHFIEFHSTDKQLIEMVRNILESNHKISVKKPRDSRHKLAYRLQLGSKEMFEDLLTLGFVPNKSLTIKFPVIPETFQKDFIRGYFDGDGCIYFKKHKVRDRKKEKWIFSSRFTSGSKRFLSELHNKLRPTIKSGFIYDKIRGFELVLSHQDSVALYHLMYHNECRGLYLNRKYKMFRKALRTLYGTKMRV